MTPRVRRWLGLALAQLAATTLLLAPVASPAWAAPGGSSEVPDEGDTNGTIDEVLDSVGRRYVEAKNAYDQSKTRQEELNKKVADAEAKRDAMLPTISKIANSSYRTGRISPISLMLNRQDSAGFFTTASRFDEYAQLNSDKIAKLQKAIDEVSRTKAALDAEVQTADKQLKIMDNKKQEAESALKLVGGQNFTGGLIDFKSKEAAPAPRAGDGSWPKESCSIPDPTTSGCITPRTKHMFDEVKKAGFDRFVGCHRNGGPFEHPKGRACDWSLQNSGFAKWHNDDTRTYGNNLMAFAVRNADRLGILYVIWNRQIWFPATGWKRYSGPSTHEDHVHISML